MAAAPLHVYQTRLGAGLAMASRRGVTAAIRRVSPNPRIHILVGAPVFIEHPARATQICADPMAACSQQAIMQPESLLMPPKCC